MLKSRTGLQVSFNADGSLHRLTHSDVLINLFPGNGVEAGATGIFLRQHKGTAFSSSPLFGPGSPSSHGSDERSFTAQGNWQGLAFTVRFILAKSAPAWFWHVTIENKNTTSAIGDLIYTQDIALASEGAVRLNEFFVSQYVDHTALHHPAHGCVVGSRQNQSVGGRFPWLLLGSLGQGVSYATDALQFYGLASRADAPWPGLTQGLPKSRLQHEHSMVGIQETPFTLAPGEKISRGFFAWFEADHPAPTVDADLRRVGEALVLPEATPPLEETVKLQISTPSLFTTAPTLQALDLEEAALVSYFGNSRRHEEKDQEHLLSFFTAQETHVVLKKKELLVLRPHGHLMRSGQSLIPEEAALVSTAWMDGVFHSMVTQGHVSINRFLTTCHGYLGFFRSYGLRIFAEVDGHWHLLGVPSAFAMTFRSCRWIYRHAGGIIEVESSALEERHALRLAVRITDGTPVRLFISCSLAINGEDSSAPPPTMDVRPEGIRIYPAPDTDVGRRFPKGFFQLTPEGTTFFEAVGHDEMLFADSLSQGKHFLCLITAPAHEVALTIEGHLLEATSEKKNATGEVLASHPTLTATASDAPMRVTDIFPWFVQNALVHYLSPRGLEQFSGGGWGTRDVCQGPVELLLALGAHEAIRDILLRVFRQQNSDGDWPQWFMFFERERTIRPDDSHGDIVYWPVLAVAQYLLATGDASLLDESTHFFHSDGPDSGEEATIAIHIERAMALMKRRVIPGTHLAAYGHGDWNDSLQPVVPAMREGLCSSWTVTLAFQTFSTLARAMRHIEQPAQATTLEKSAAQILDEFQRLLVRDNVVAGLADFRRGRSPVLLLHPLDDKTGLHYSLLPMIHAIIHEMFDPAQATHHLSLIRQHLHGLDGARLFDRPIAYHGGPMTLFQRAESASYFGREIGLMYTHAHLRYVEALARYGDAERFFIELCRVNPIGLRALVPSATIRQSNCYYSSSDAKFSDRYQASDFYENALDGKVALEGGWRVYSSGAGIAARLIMQCLLGLRLQTNTLVLDPMIPPSLGDVEAQLSLWNRPFLIKYQPGAEGRDPVSISLNGRTISFERELNRYRQGGAIIFMTDIQSAWRTGTNILKITLR